MAPTVDCKRVRTELESSRDAMTAYAAALRHDLDLGSKLKRGVRNHPLGWYAAAGVLGLLLSKIPPLHRRVVVKGPKLPGNAPEEAGLIALGIPVLKFALDFAKPALLRWFKDRFLRTGRPPRGSRV